MDTTEKITLIVALCVAVVYLWRAYTASRDDAIKLLQDEIAALRAQLKETQDHEKV